MPDANCASGRSPFGSWSARWWSWQDGPSAPPPISFREDVLTRLVARQAEMRFAYEDRIAELRARVDRFSSRQLLDQEQYEQKLDQILRRQTALESRASALNGLGDMTGAIKLPARSALIGEPRAIPPKPSHD